MDEIYINLVGNSILFLIASIAFTARNFSGFIRLGIDKKALRETRVELNCLGLRTHGGILPF